MDALNFLESAPVIAIITATLVGGWVGSFLALAWYRVPRGLSVVHPGSRCPTCKQPIRPLDLLPVFGWVRLRGKCRDCGAEVAMFYPLIEFSTAFVFGFGVWCLLGG